MARYLIEKKCRQKWSFDKAPAFYVKPPKNARIECYGMGFSVWDKAGGCHYYARVSGGYAHSAGDPAAFIVGLGKIVDTPEARANYEKVKKALGIK